MNPNLKNTSGLGVCAFCGSGDHVFTKETCPQFMEQARLERNSFLSAIDQMGYSETEFLEDIQKSKVNSILGMMKKGSHIFKIQEVTAVKNYINLHKKD